MSILLLKSLNPVRIRVAVTLASPQAHNLYSFLRSHPFSSPCIETGSIRNSFTVDYLINSCGFTPKKAIAASKYMKFEASDRPDSVLSFFKDQGFTQVQISKIIYRVPLLLISDPEKTLLPKVEFFKSKGISASDTAVIISTWPDLLKRSLEHQLIPSFDFFSNLLHSSEKKNINAFKRCVGVLLFDLEKHGAANTEILKKAGVSLKNIGFLLANQPRALMTNCNNFRQIVDEVIKMDFDPLRFKFVAAVIALRSMTKPTWNRKLEVYKKWGWSEEEIDAAFRYNPRIMTLSEDKITLVMDFWVNKMGWESSFLATIPTILLLSLEKRILPRCEIYQALLSKGVKKPCGLSLSTFLIVDDTKLLQKIVDCHEEEAPELLKLYTKKR